MSVSRRIPATVLSLFVVLTAACGTGGRAPAGTGPEAGSAAEIEAIYRARTDSARAVFSEADVRFVSGMIAHHAQALAMAELASSHGASPGVQLLAARIDNGQRDEIATMQRWLRDRGRPVPEIDAAHGMMHGPAAGRSMPGMVTPAQFRELDAARGAEFDRLFLTLMIQHHRGAVVMVEELYASERAAQGDEVFRLASDIQADQIAEIARMERMLAALNPIPGVR